MDNLKPETKEEKIVQDIVLLYKFLKERRPEAELWEAVNQATHKYDE